MTSAVPLYVVMDGRHLMVATHSLRVALRVFNRGGCEGSYLPAGQPHSDDAQYCDSGCRHVPLTGKLVSKASKGSKPIATRWVFWNSQHEIRFYITQVHVT